MEEADHGPLLEAWLARQPVSQIRKTKSSDLHQLRHYSLAMDEADHAPLLEERLARQPVRNFHQFRLTK